MYARCARQVIECDEVRFKDVHDVEFVAARCEVCRLGRVLADHGGPPHGLDRRVDARLDRRAAVPPRAAFTSCSVGDLPGRAAGARRP